MLARNWRMARFAAVWILTTGLMACAAGPRVELSVAAASRIKTIALLDIAEPTIDQVLNRGSSNESHSTTYAQMLTDAQVEFSPLLAEAITRQLERSDYRVLSLPTQRPVVSGNDQIDLSAIDTDADAILVARFKGAGYASSSTAALQPWAIVEVQLFDTRTRKALYVRTFNGGADLGIDGAVHLATRARYQYASPAQLDTQLDDSVDGIKDAELAIADAIGQDFAIGSRPVAGAVEPARLAVVPEKTAAERDREAATALAAQWAEAAPPPVPAVDAMPATTADDRASTNADASPATEAQTAVGERDTEPAITAAAPGDAVASDTSQQPTPVAGVAEPAGPETATLSSDTAADAVNDENQTPAVSSAAPAPAPVADVPPVAPLVPAAPAAAMPARSGPGLVLKQRTPVRVSPTARAKVFAFLPAGTSITRGKRVIHNGSGSWCFVEAGAINGWVPIEATQP